MTNTDHSNNSSSADVGMVGLGVMGRNLSLNLADHGFSVVGFDLDEIARTALENEYQKESDLIQGQDNRAAVRSVASMRELVTSLDSPRVIIVLVPAGPAVDKVCESLIKAGVEPNDIVVDCGNSQWTDTIERAEKYDGQLTFFGSGVSGGEVGARFGPSLMPGGNQEAWGHLKPMWEAIAAKVDATTGKELEGATPGNPITAGVPCTAWIGPGGAGHYVKMVHNGIEYADMQLICEAAHLMGALLDISPRNASAIFANWNEQELDSFLIEITADILQQDDPVTGQPFVEVVVDRAAQKGTGRWTAVSALDTGIPAVTIAEAVFARSMSALKEERLAAAKMLQGPTPDGATSLDHDALITAIRDALYCSKICAYAQGFQLMQQMAGGYDWSLDFREIASLWRGGCIIRARFLQKIMEAYEADADLPNLLLGDYFKSEIAARQGNWRSVVSIAVTRGIPVPAFASSLAYYDSYRTATLPANLLQAQRDYFGAHGYERVDSQPGKKFHLDWPESPRVQMEL